MAENKFIQHLKGTETAGSVLEIKNQGTPATFGNMPAGTSNPNAAYADARGDATAVLKGTDVWKLDGSSLELASRVYGDGRDFTDTYTASGSSLWINATHTFDSAKIFGANTKWVLKLCGANLLSAVADTIDFSLIIKFGSTPLVTKTFTVAEQANNFCQQFVIDFNGGAQNVIKATNGDTMTIQLLCGDSTASATIYNGMTTLTALQRRVDGDVVASDTSTFDDLEQGLARKVDKTSAPSVVYGTDATGAQTTYDVDDFGQVDDVQIDGVSIVQNKIADIPMSTYLGDYVPKTGGTLTGGLAFQYNTSYPVLRIIQSGQNTNHLRFINNSYASQSISFDLSQAAIHPLVSGRGHLGTSNIHFGDAHIDKVYTGFINNGYDIAVPVTNSPDTLALKSEVDLAANSGRMITDQGVWYAKMYTATVVPSATDGTNYADFSQTDGQGNPIIVIYERQNGAWVQDQTITPPAEYDGYVPITSKIWDIPEQTGQQGGRILWNHTSKDFTPYPMIVSFDGANITNGAFQGSADLSGTSTVTMPVSPSSTQIVNKDYVDTAIAAIPSGAFDLFDIKWRDATTSNSAWALADGNYITKATKPTAYQHLYDEWNALKETVWSISIVNVGYWYSNSSLDQPGESHPYAFTNEFGENLAYADTAQPAVGAALYDGPTSSATLVGNLTGAYEDWVIWMDKETIAGTTIPYMVAADGHKIVYSSDKSDVDAVYAATGVAWYYILDRSNEQFMLPRKTSMQIVRSVQNSDHSWYRLYANGWVEQGGRIKLNGAVSATNKRITFPVVMATSKYRATADPNANTGVSNIMVGWESTTGMSIGTQSGASTGETTWEVEGMSAIDMTNEKNGQKYLYFYVGA